MNAAPRQKRGAGELPELELSTPKARATADAWSKKGHSCRSLPTRFRHKKFDYRQIAREDNIAAYEQTWNSPLSRSVCYEVIRIRRREDFQIGARLVEAAEFYPNAEAWGLNGFTLTDKDVAFAKLREIST